ncbi:MAG: polyprenyl synthetase family protein [Thermodesulfobacteriota bacterium]
MEFNLQQYLEQNRKLVNQYLKLILEQFSSKQELISAMNHSLMAKGKRLRPILSIAAAQACNKDFLPALPACCAIEMIHTYSLIHDDLPAMDDDDLRRGLPTCHKKFSEATAILAGDALLTHAFNIISSPEPFFKIYPDNRTRLLLISKISQAAGSQGMVEGQMMDMKSFQNRQKKDLAHLEKIHSLKTGKMITLSVEAGAISIGADPEIIKQLLIYADKIGLAFQVADDILNIEGDPKKMGKAAGSDILNDKMTFPAIIGLDESKKYAKELVGEAIEAITGFDESASPLRSIANYIINRDH